MTFEIKNICCIGAGYVGGPTMSVLADKCPKIQINVVDLNASRIEEWNSDDLSKLPIFEPGLPEIVKRARSKNLFFSSDIKGAIKNSQMVFISVNTPTKLKGIGAGQASDLKYVEACARQVALHASNHTIVVEKSTLPVRTAQVIETILESAQTFQSDNTKSFDVLSNPEFLAEGTAIEDLENPDRVLIGGENLKAIESLSEIYRNWIPQNKILKTNVWSSELAKLTSNAFLAQRISSINSISAICEVTGADIREVSRAIGSDTRIGSKFLESGPGFGGSCFKKDILNLVYLAKFYGLIEVAEFWESVVHINKWHQSRISQLVVKKLFGTLSGKKIAIFGFAFKANTNDTRESAAIQICKDLINEGGNLVIHDPKVDPLQISHDLGQEPLKTIDESNLINSNGSWQFSKHIDILENCHAALILTEWDDYKKINWDLASNKMLSPAWVFDSRAILEKEKVIKAGINFWRIGDGS